MAINKKSDVVVLFYEKKGIDGRENDPKTGDVIPKVLKLRWHGDEFHLRPGKGEKLPREGAQYIIQQMKHTQQNPSFKNETLTRNVVLSIKELVVKEEISQ